MSIKKGKILKEKFEGWKKEVEKSKINDEDRKFLELCNHYYSAALDYFDSDLLEVPLILLCTIVEASGNREKDHHQYHEWLLSKENTPLRKKLRDNRSDKEFKQILKDENKKYFKQFGVKQNFKKTIMNCFKDKIPPWIYYETVPPLLSGREGEILTEEEANEINTKLKDELEDYITVVYDEYRSQFIHRGKKLPWGVGLSERIGWRSSKVHHHARGGVKIKWEATISDFAFIVLEVMNNSLKTMSGK